MKKILMMGLVFTLVLTASCHSEAAKEHPYEGTFFTENGVRFELRADSTTLITFNDSLTYEGIWKPCVAEDRLKYASIEFAGYIHYYYLHNGKLYRSEREMRHDFMGTKVKYID